MSSPRHETLTMPMDWTERALAAALAWAGVDRGRARGLLAETQKLASASSASADQIIAHDEASIVLQVYYLWKRTVHSYPGLIERIRESFASGTWLPDDEVRGKPHNAPRNNLFTYYTAGWLAAVGLVDVVSVDGIARADAPAAGTHDIVLRWKDRDLPMECKRPFDDGTLGSLVKEGSKQLARAGTGIVAVDCSKLVRPKGHYLSVRGKGDVGRELVRMLKEKCLTPVERALRAPAIGALLMAHVPATAATSPSPILSPSGQPFAKKGMVSVGRWVVCQRAMEEDLLATFVRVLAAETVIV